MKRMADIKPGIIVKVEDLDSGRRLRKRLIDLGLFEDEPVRVIVNYGHGPMVISIKGTNMILGRGICKKIFVKELSDYENHATIHTGNSRTTELRKNNPV
ncbi:MAG: FeoA family protein [Spirochaetota bacterium]